MQRSCTKRKFSVHLCENNYCFFQHFFFLFFRPTTQPGEFHQMWLYLFVSSSSDQYFVVVVFFFTTLGFIFRIFGYLVESLKLHLVHVMQTYSHTHTHQPNDLRTKSHVELTRNQMNKAIFYLPSNECEWCFFYFRAESNKKSGAEIFRDLIELVSLA